MTQPIKSVSPARSVKRLPAIVIINLVVLEAVSFLAIVGLGVVSPDRRWDLFLEAQLSVKGDAPL